MHTLWLLLLPLAAASGWLTAAGKNYFTSKEDDDDDEGEKGLPRDYLKGLNFLLNEEPDKAIDVFIKMLEIDSETVETHLALGNLFRRRGEVNRATRIHQNLIARPNLDLEYRAQALLALAQDYLSAGFLDRAERLFLELLEIGKFPEISIRGLIDIYQQEKEWSKAIQIALRQAPLFRGAIAHYYCELAEQLINRNEFEEAEKHLKQALVTDKSCVRVNLLAAKIAMEQKQYMQAIKLLKKIRYQDPDYLAEAVIPLAQAYQAANQLQDMLLYFKSILKEIPRIPIVVILSEHIRAWRGDQVAAHFVANYVRKHPSIAGIHRLVELYLPLTTQSKAKRDLEILHELTAKLLKDHPPYQCTKCGFEVSHLLWQCPGCKEWNTIKPTYTLDLKSA